MALFDLNNDDERVGFQSFKWLTTNDYYTHVGGNGPFGVPPDNVVSKTAGDSVAAFANLLAGEPRVESFPLGRTEVIRAQNNLFWGLSAIIGFGVVKALLPVRAHTIPLQLGHTALNVGTLGFNIAPAIAVLLLHGAQE